MHQFCAGRKYGTEENVTAIGTMSDGTDADQSCAGCSFWTSDVVRASLVLAVAICLEVTGTMYMKLSDGIGGLSHPLWFLCFI